MREIHSIFYILFNFPLFFLKRNFNLHLQRDTSLFANGLTFDSTSGFSPSSMYEGYLHGKSCPLFLFYTFHVRYLLSCWFRIVVILKHKYSAYIFYYALFFPFSFMNTVVSHAPTFFTHHFMSVVVNNKTDRTVVLVLVPFSQTNLNKVSIRDFSSKSVSVRQLKPAYQRMT